MRETHFRAWDIKQKRYLDRIYCIYYDMASKFHHVEGLSGYSDVKLLYDEVILEQDTGLKDKNGKKICEGDIVRCHGDDRFIAPVIRHDNSGGFCWVSCYKEECFIPESDEVEVIGNIHENQELLRGEE